MNSKIIFNEKLARLLSHKQLKKINKLISNFLICHSYSITIEEIRAKSIVGIAIKDGIKYFFKISDKNSIYNEISNTDKARHLGYRVPVIVCSFFYELYGAILTEYLDKNTHISLSEMISNITLNHEENITNIINIFDTIFKKSILTLDVKKEAGGNDTFFYYRMMKNGRFEKFYLNNEFNLNGVKINLKTIRNSKFRINGILYKETFGELITNSINFCSPSIYRPMWISHGDLVETNIYMKNNHEIGFFDMETFGLNWAISDYIIPLVGMSIMFDYTIPMYSQSSLYDADLLIKNALDNAHKEIVYTEYNETKEIISIDNFISIGTQKIRNKLVNEFCNNLISPFVEKINRSKMPVYLEEQIKACFFLRFFAVHNIQKWNPNDQARLFCILFLTIGTPLFKDKSPSIYNFIKLL